MIYDSVNSGFYWNTANIRANEYNRQIKQKTKGSNIQVLTSYEFRKIGNPSGNTTLQDKGGRKKQKTKHAVILLLNKVL